MHYFIRANGDTLHNDPSKPEFYVPGEPPDYPQTYFNALPYCFRENIVRIGWPDVGDLRSASRQGAVARGYGLGSVEPYVRKYLETFRDIRVGNVVLVPDKDVVGDVYIADVVSGYDYFHHVPGHPYEHSHRLGVKWDRDSNNAPIVYRAGELGVPIRGGIWTRAFAVIDHCADAEEMIRKIEAARNRTGRIA